MRPDGLRKAPEGYFTSRFGHPEYTDWIDESLSWKRTCSIGDWSFLWQRRYCGRDALRLFSDYSVNSFAKFNHLQSKHVIHCNPQGKVIHEGILSRLGDEEFMLFGRGGFWIDYQLRRGGYNVSTETEEGFNFQIAGPSAPAVIEKLAGSDVLATRFMHATEIAIAGRPVLALRQGMSGEAGFELQGKAEHAAEVYDAVLRAGEEFGIRKLGGRAAMINHLEACFPTIVTDYLPAIFEPDMAEYLEEFQSAMPAYASTFNVNGSFDSENIADWYRSPVELGWGKNVKFDHAFMGRQALEAELARPMRVMRTLVWDPADIVAVFASLFQEGEPYHFMEMPRDQRGYMHADRVLADGIDVGISTSRGYSYFFREMLSLCVIDTAYAEPGTRVKVMWGNPGRPQRSIAATVARAPYKEDHRRAELTSAIRASESLKRGRECFNQVT